MSFEHDHNKDQLTDVAEAPAPSAVDAALEKIQAAADTVDSGPGKIEKSLTKLKDAVFEYRNAYDVLHGLDAAGSATPPGRLAGVRAVDSLKNKKKVKK